MDKNYLESKIDDLEWKLFTLLAAGEKRKLTRTEKAQIETLKRKIQRLKQQLKNMR